MRIEYQGHVQAKTYFTHVGYVSAGMTVGGDIRTDPLSGLYLGGGVLLLVLSLIAARSLKSRWRWLLAALLILAGVGSGLRGYARSSCVIISPPYYLTLYRIEKLSAQTEEWVKRHGRAPTRAEWEAMHPGQESQDGWGRPLRYQPLAKLGEHRPIYMRRADTTNLMTHFGFVIWWPVLKPTSDWPDERELTNWHFGADGLFDTEDDEPALHWGGFRHKQLDPNRYPHARAPRTGGIANAH